MSNTFSFNLVVNDAWAPILPRIDGVPGRIHEIIFDVPGTVIPEADGGGVGESIWAFFGDNPAEGEAKLVIPDLSFIFNPGVAVADIPKVRTVTSAATITIRVTITVD